MQTKHIITSQHTIHAQTQIGIEKEEKTISNDIVSRINAYNGIIGQRLEFPVENELLWMSCAVVKYSLIALMHKSINRTFYRSLAATHDVEPHSY